MMDNTTNFPEIKSQDYQNLCKQSAAVFCERISGMIMKSIGGKLDAATMPGLNASQITLTAYVFFRNEMLEGGFIQLIHNGYGAFIFENPFAKAMRLWGMKDLCNMIYDARKFYDKHKNAIMRDCSEDEFMSLYEQFEEFDSFDDEYIETEPQYTENIAYHVKDNIDDFVRII